MDIDKLLDPVPAAAAAETVENLPTFPLDPKKTWAEKIFPLTTFFCVKCKNAYTHKSNFVNGGQVCHGCFYQPTQFEKNLQLRPYELMEFPAPLKLQRTSHYSVDVEEMDIDENKTV